MEKEGKKRIPQFRSREEEAEFWDSHSPLDFPDEIKQVEMRVRKPLKGVLAIRLGDKHLQELRELAEHYEVGPTTLARMFIVSSLNACRESGSLGILPAATIPQEKVVAKDILQGDTSAPGVVEGIARVIVCEAEIDQVQRGEILVCPMTSASWAPIFSRVNAVVTDAGGLLAHAVLVGREYGIPVVAGTMEATTKIKTGDRISVDGNCLRVSVLE